MSERFIVTKEHRRFTEFADSVRRGRTIGLCFGPAGVGKTVSARRYAHWNQAHELLTDWGPRSDDDAKIYAALAKNRTALYTPGVLTTPRLLREDLDRIITRTSICIQQHLEVPGRIPLDRWGTRRTTNYVQLVIVDESERLSPTALELLRDRYDRDQIALMLIGMPGLEKQFTHYPQFYSRVGFAHQYRPLSNDELLFVLQRHWRTLGKTVNPDDFTDAQAIAAISRITRGNFRLLERLFPQIERVLKINELQTITNDVVEAAASTLVIGVNSAPPPSDGRSPPRTGESHTHHRRTRPARNRSGARHRGWNHARASAGDGTGGALCRRTACPALRAR